MDLLAYADGTRDLIDISDTIHVPVRRLYPLVDALVQEGLLAEAGAGGRPA
jgi:aminopeptidase-like protein